MTTDARIARRYAQALFNAARKASSVDAVEADLAAISEAAATDERTYDYIVAPFYTREEKKALFTEKFGDRLSPLTLQVLRLMIDKGREMDIPGLGAAFTAIRRDAEGIVSARVESAEEMGPEARAELERKLAIRLGRRVEATYAVDPSLIGGVRVAYDSFVLDGTVKGSLAQLRERLKYDLLKQN